MLFIFDVPEGANREAARDFIVQQLDAIAERVHRVHGDSPGPLSLETPRPYGAIFR